VNVAEPILVACDLPGDVRKRASAKKIDIVHTRSIDEFLFTANRRLYHVFALFVFVDDDARASMEANRRQSPCIPFEFRERNFPSRLMPCEIIAFAIVTVAILNLINIFRTVAACLRYISENQRRSERFIPDVRSNRGPLVWRNADIPAMVGISFGT